MPTIFGGRRRGLQRGVTKHTVRGKADGIDGENQGKFLVVRKKEIGRLAKFCFEKLYKACGKLFLLPYTRTVEGQYVELDGKALGIHRFVVGVALGILAQKSWLTLNYLMIEDLKIESFMCIALTSVYLGTFLIASGILLKPKEATDLLNAGPFILGCLKTFTGKDVKPLDNVVTALQIIIVSVGTQAVPIVDMYLGLHFGTLPVCLYPGLKNIGLIPADDGGLSTFTWQLICAPLEWMTYAPAVLVMAYAVNVFLIGTGVAHTFIKHLKAVAVNDMATRKTLERLYVCIELYNRVLSVWTRFVIVPSILSISLFIVLCVFVSIRYTHLPFFFYIFFPYVGVVAMGGIFWMCYDITLMLRDAEDVVQKLVSYQAFDFRNMPKTMMTRIMKRAKAMRPLTLPVGPFAQFSLALPVIIWDEILNQVLFLLSF